MSLPKVLAVCGPSGVGKTTAVKLLCSVYPGLSRIRTATTRPPRSGEVDGEDYLFLHPADFERAQAEGALIAATVYAGHRYAVPLESLSSALREGLSPAVVVDVAGVAALREAYPGKVVAAVLDMPQREIDLRLLSRDGAGSGSAMRRDSAASERSSALRAGCAYVSAYDTEEAVIAIYGLLA